MPESAALRPAVLRVTEYFSEPHLLLELNDQGRDLHMSYQGGLNVESHLYREAGDIQGGARMGAAPWQCGVLAGLLLVFDIFWGRYPTEVLQKRDLQITKEHLERAFALLHVARDFAQ